MKLFICSLLLLVLCGCKVEQHTGVVIDVYEKKHSGILTGTFTEWYTVVEFSDKMRCSYRERRYKVGESGFFNREILSDGTIRCF